MTLYNENQTIKVIHVIEDFFWATTSYNYHPKKNQPYRGKNSQITQNLSSPKGLKFSSFPSLFLLLFHCLIFSFFSLPYVNFFSYWSLYEYSSTSNISREKRSVATAEKMKGYNCKSMFFIQNRLILLFFAHKVQCIKIPF